MGGVRLDPLDIPIREIRVPWRATAGFRKRRIGGGA